MSDFELTYDFSDWEFGDDTEEEQAFVEFHRRIQEARRKSFKRMFEEGEWRMIAGECKDGSVLVALVNNDEEIALQTVQLIPWEE